MNIFSRIYLEKSGIVLQNRQNEFQKELELYADEGKNKSYI